ncbi:TonB-linked outer membrane protein, SusC/RagA family [compost metagenome]
MNHHQGNSLLSFSLSKGSISEVKFFAELGKGCDVAVLNAVMSYKNWTKIKDGKYALKVAFRLKGANEVIHNETVAFPEGFTVLKTLTIMAALPENVIAGTGFQSEAVRLRGANSGETSSSPMVIVNGKIASDEEVGKISPNLIEHITLLKGPSATHLYGQQAQHGAIVLELKKPESDIADTKIRIRGKNAVTGLNPLVIVDGTVSESGGLDLINPNQIESITILKDAASIAQYGPEAQHGVILLTTKKTDKEKTN